MRKWIALLLTVYMCINAVAPGVTALAEEPMVLQLWTSNEEVSSNPDSFYLNKLRDDFNIDFDIRVRGVGSTDYMDWLNLTLMTPGEEPDWIRDQAISLATYQQYVDEGILLELDEEMIRTYMPNYIKWTEKYEDIFGTNALNLYKVDGKIYSIPDAKVDLANFCYMGYRQDWLDALGYEKTPETLEEMIAFMRDVTFKDPDGNGVDDTYGYLGITNTVSWGFSPFFGAYGVYPDLFYEKDGKVVYGNVEPETRTVLELLRDLYAEGIIDPEWVTLGFDGVMDKIVTGKDGVTWQNWLSFYGEDGYVDTMQQMTPDVAWTASTGPIGPDGEQGIMNFNPLAGVGLMFTVALEDQEEKLIKYMQVFDAMLGDPTYYEAEIWGEKGVTFTVDENGDRTYMEGWDSQKLFDYGVGADYRFPSLELFGYDPDIHDQVEFNQKTLALRQELLAMSKGKYDIMSNFDRPVWNDVKADLPNFETMATAIIMGEADISTFDEYVTQWYAAGGDQVMEEAQQIFDLYLK